MTKHVAIPHDDPGAAHRHEKDQRALKWARYDHAGRPSKPSPLYVPHGVPVLEPVEDDTQRFVRGFLSQRGQ